VALNYQTHDKHVIINEGKFRDNGGCGYILKPTILRNPSTPFDPDQLRTFVPTSKIRKLKIEVINARNLPKPFPKQEKQKPKSFISKFKTAGSTPTFVDPFVRIKVVGVPCDCKKVKTSKVNDNGFNPEWMEMFEFDFMMSEMDVIVFTVYSQEGVGRSKLAYISAPVETLTDGYRILELLDPKQGGKKIPLCNLFCRFQIFT